MFDLLMRLDGFINLRVGISILSTNMAEVVGCRLYVGFIKNSTPSEPVWSYKI